MLGRVVKPPASPPHRLCPACGRDNADRPALATSVEPWMLKSCRQCAFVYLENAPVYEALDEDFAWEKTYEAERARRHREEPVFHWVGRRLIDIRRVLFKKRGLFTLTEQFVPAGHVLDVGCSDAALLSRLGPRYVPHGIEVSAALARRASQVLASRGGTVLHANALDGLAQFPPDHFSGVWMHSFLEHERQPLPVLRAAARVLRADGRLIMKMPNYASVNRSVRGARWCGFRFPDHVNYFTPESLRRMVQDAGLNVVRMRLSDRMPTSDNMWLVAGLPG
jgi:SAM-dependent methyltransferase